MAFQIMSTLSISASVAILDPLRCAEYILPVVSVVPLARVWVTGQTGRPTFAK